MKRIALFAGTFDPFTIGHDNIVTRALPLFDRLVIAVVGDNVNKPSMSPAKQRVEAIRKIYANCAAIEVKSYTGLTVDLAREEGATYIIKGVRSVRDFEYEREQADINRRLSGIDTLLLMAEPHLADISSSMVRELRHFGRDVREFLPQHS